MKREGICREADMAGALGERSTPLIAHAMPAQTLAIGDVLGLLVIVVWYALKMQTACRRSLGGVAGIYESERNLLLLSCNLSAAAVSNGQ